MQSLEYRKFPPSSLLGKGLTAAALLAGKRGSSEIQTEDLLAGCLQALSRFGIALISDLAIDLDRFGISSLPVPDAAANRAEYSQDAIAILHRASEIATAEDSNDPEI